MISTLIGFDALIFGEISGTTGPDFRCPVEKVASYPFSPAVSLDRSTSSTTRRARRWRRKSRRLSRPIVLGKLQDVTDGNGREAAREVAHHVHAAGERAGVFAADVHAPAPASRQRQVEDEAGQPHGETIAATGFFNR